MLLLEEEECKEGEIPLLKKETSMMIMIPTVFHPHPTPIMHQGATTITTPIKVPDGLARNKMTRIAQTLQIIMLTLQEVLHMASQEVLLPMGHMGVMDQLLEAAVAPTVVMEVMDHRPLPVTEHRPLPATDHHPPLPPHHTMVEAPILAHGVREAHPPPLIDGVAILTTMSEEGRDDILSK